MIVAANWKLNKSPAEARQFFKDFKAQWTQKNHKVVIFPSAFAMEACSTELKGSEISFGAQNIFSESKGAFTGENSAQVLKELGGSYVLIGHSERRALFGEKHEMLAQKVKHVQELGLTPLFCIGETLAEREAGKTHSVLVEQIKQGLKGVNPQAPLVVAYEPVWAIGTGKVATSEQVAETHTWVNEILCDYGFKGVAILYGGSVKAESAAELGRQPFVAGFLVGGASLEVNSFLGILSQAPS